MTSVETFVDRYDDLTYVRARVTNGRTTPQRVRIRSLLDGPTWAPCGERVSVPEWRGDVWEARVDPGRTVGLGFVTPGDPEDPPLEIVSRERVSSDEDDDSDAVLADLEDARPPAELLTEDP